MLSMPPHGITSQRAVATLGESGAPAQARPSQIHVALMATRVGSSHATQMRESAGHMAAYSRPAHTATSSARCCAAYVRDMTSAAEPERAAEESAAAEAPLSCAQELAAWPRRRARTQGGREARRRSA